MAWIGPSEGILKLYDSDNWCGSYFSLSDTCEILQIPQSNLKLLPSKTFDNEIYYSELDLHREWSSGHLRSPLSPKIGNTSRSLDELIIARLFEITLPGSQVESQVKFNRKYAGLSVEYNGQKKYIEFVGPSHFIPQYQLTG